MKKLAIIIGSGGQDGKILTDYLLSKNYSLIGVGKKIRTSDIDITKSDEVFELVKKHKPNEIYYLAAYHHSSEEKDENQLELIKQSYEVNVFGLANFLEAIRVYSKNTRIFYASSSLVFAGTDTSIQDEATPHSPKCIYGITKQDGAELCRLYRDEYNVFASVGILYNHESNYRTDNFLSKKIIKNVIAIKKGEKQRLVVGNLSAETDWGYAPDYIDAFYKILNLDRPDDFIVATGVKKTVLDFVKTAFDCLGMDWEKYVVEDKDIVKRQKRSLVGNSKKLTTKTGWSPTVDFPQMVRILLEIEERNIDA